MHYKLRTILKKILRSIMHCFNDCKYFSLALKLLEINRALLEPPIIQRNPMFTLKIVIFLMILLNMMVTTLIVYFFYDIIKDESFMSIKIFAIKSTSNKKNESLMSTATTAQTGKKKKKISIFINISRTGSKLI